ncbi:MAG: tRNA lysidine(34) synthetase TilS [Bacteroidota bacterium]
MLVAFSGGPDSLALLHLLRRVEKDWCIAAGHIDHAMRPESASEALFLREWASHEGIPFFCERIPTPQSEAEARRARYEALNRMAKDWGADYLLFGHHADDQLETILLRIVRGAALAGLRGIPFRREQKDGPPILRPLLFLERERIEEYVRFHDLKPLSDPSNASIVYSRNRIRQLLPVLKGINPRAALVASRNARVLAEEDSFLEELIRPHWERIATISDGVTLEQKELLLLHPVLRRRLVLWAMAEVYGGHTVFTGEHLERVLALLEAGGRVCLPNGIEAEVRLGELWIGPTPSVEAIPFSSEGMEGMGWRIESFDPFVPSDKSLDAFRVAFDREGLPKDLCWRHPREGDRFHPWGHTRPHSLEHFFTRDRIPPARRKRALVLASGCEILWVVGIRRSVHAPCVPETPVGRAFGLLATPLASFDKGAWPPYHDLITKKEEPYGLE